MTRKNNRTKKNQNEKSTNPTQKLRCKRPSKVLSSLPACTRSLLPLSPAIPTVVGRSYEAEWATGSRRCTEHREKTFNHRPDISDRPEITQCLGAVLPLQSEMGEVDKLRISTLGQGQDRASANLTSIPPGFKLRLTPCCCPPEDPHGLFHT